ncbi:hypothetical protein Taro_028795 [Colocasia esculenta]|uniref:Uncharacterized protein n=1 Tax=Colocasia esculenta TaxID=4460 RepID=A0A843VHC5_COLES|nr:hypothetical protein [Colocasia esculenta]
MCEYRLWNPLIRRFEASSDVLQQLERAPNMRERHPHTGVQRRSTQNSDRGSFEDSLAQAEEGFSSLNCCLWIFQEASAEISTFSEEIDMASRGRRGVPAREGEKRRHEPLHEDQGEQQAPATLGLVLPPPPPVDYGTQAHTQAALQAQLEAQERADVWWSSLLRTWFEDRAVEALSATCRQEGEMEQYLEEKKASQKRPERKKAAFQSPQRPMASRSSQVPSQHSPSGKKECSHCGRAHGGMECWMLAGKFLKCGSSEHRIKDCPRLQQGAYRIIVG